MCDLTSNSIAIVHNCSTITGRVQPLVYLHASKLNNFYLYRKILFLDNCQKTVMSESVLNWLTYFLLLLLLLLRLNQMLYYALCLSYHSNTSCFVCMSFVRLGHHNGSSSRLLGSKVGNSINCLSQGHSDALLHRESNQGFATFRLLARCLYQLSGTTPPPLLTAFFSYYIQRY